MFAGDDGDDAHVQRHHPARRLDRAEHEDLHRRQDEDAEAGHHDLEAEKVSCGLGFAPRARFYKTSSQLQIELC